MAAPTPISALVHSSTLVTAGIFFLFRFSPILPLGSLSPICFIGAFTVYLGSLGSCVDMNSKKIVAYSTISQLGFIVFCQGLGLDLLAFGYMMLHAFVKALLFLSVGSHMLFVNHSQDSRNMYVKLSLSPFINISLFFCVYILGGLSFSPIHLFKFQLLRLSFLRCYYKFFLIFLIVISSLLTLYYCTLLYCTLIFSRHVLSSKYNCVFNLDIFSYLYILFLGLFFLSFHFSFFFFSLSFFYTFFFFSSFLLLLLLNN